MTTTQELVNRSLRRHAHRTAVVDEGRRLTYAQLDLRSRQLARVLRDTGCGDTVPVALYLPNCSEYLEADVATGRAGILRVGIGERLSADEVEYIVADSGAAVVITTTDLLERLRSGGAQLPRVITVGEEYEALLADAQDDEAWRTAAPDDAAYLMYTSGTTGRPKGATHTQQGRVASTVNMLSCEQNLTSDSVMVHAAPLTHGSGSKVLGVLATGGVNVVMRRFRADEFAATVRAEAGTHTFLVPTMLQRLVTADEGVHEAVRTMRQITFGGAPISAELFRRAVETFGPILTQIYGASEAPHPVTLLRPDDYADDLSDATLSSAGYPPPAVEIRILDADGAPVQDGVVGELVMRTPSLMSGYWNRREATDEVLDDDGWYHSGDLVARDERGAISFQDRKRDLVITGGMNVYPTEVERVIEGHDEVSMVAVVGFPDDEWGESLAAFIVRVPGSALTADDLLLWLRDRLAGYKKPRKVEFVDELPLGSSNKVLKRELRERLWAGRDRRVG